MSEQNKVLKSMKDGNEHNSTVNIELGNSPNVCCKRKNSERMASKRKKINVQGTEGVRTFEIPPQTSANADTVEDVLEDMKEEIDDALEKPCYKNKLTPTNVKNILRHIMANEYVLAMVRNTMKLEHNEEELGDVAYEPKLTRSKAKEMRKKQGSLPWPVSSPAKKLPKVSKQLLETEFPDESSDDEDYQPNEEECRSDDDDLTLSPKSDELETSSRRVSCSLSPVSKVVEPISEDENALIIELLEAEVPLDTSEADKIALRTRSKLCLNDTSLEEIEASFIAPDITMDMYNTHCDNEDWHSFLCELIKPLDSTVMLDHPDDAENDPEYKVIEEDVPDYDDLCYEKITRDELNGLVAECLDGPSQQDLNFLDDEEEFEEQRITVENVGSPSEINVGPVSVENVRVMWMTSEERLQLDEQMRMHVQLLSQSYLLSHGNPALHNLNISAKIFLDEIKMFSTREMASANKSAFYAQNLDGALAIVNEFENVSLPLRSKNISASKKSLPAVPLHVRKTLATNKVFIYPELLPTCGFRDNIEKYNLFSTPEDNLIALGLEQFSVLKNPVECIHKYLVPAKTVVQIKFRIKNSKFKRDPLTNPIKFYHVYNKAPQFQRVIRIFDPDNIKAPEEYQPEFLPKWMESFRKLTKTSPINPVLAPIQTVKPSRKVAVIRPTFRKPLEPRKYSPILPRGLHFSPLKQISPILKKYSQQRRIVPIQPFSSGSPHKTPPLLKPKPEPSSTNSNLNANIVSSINQKLSKGPANKELKASLATCKTVQQTSPTSKKSNISIVIHGKESAAFQENPMSSPESSLTKKPNQNFESPVAKSTKLETETPVETEVSDEVDEEVIEDEHESTATVVVSTTTIGKKQSVSKKRNRHQRDLEASLALLQPTLVKYDSTKEEREVLFANSYLLRATEILKGNPEVYEKFLSTLCKFHLSTRSPVELYLELKEILKDYPTLVRDFIVFLRPEQAKECGRYKEHIALSKIREFFKKIEIHFKNQPQHISRILRTFAQLQQQVDITSSEVVSALQPLLRNQTHLMEELNHLLPDVAPPEYLMTDFEEMTIPNSDDDDSSIDSYEEIIIPDTPDPYGGKDCPCDCHNSSTDNRLLNKIRHCVKCGVKFIDGRIYIQTGKVLKPAQVIYHNPPKSAKAEKLNCQQMSSKSQQTSEAASKTVPSKTQQALDSSSSKTAPPKAQQVSDATVKAVSTKTHQAHDTIPKAAPPKTQQVPEIVSKNALIPEKSSKTDVSVAKMDVTKVSNTVQKAIITCNDASIPTSSKLPCDVLEDAVFPASTSSLNKNSPSDFSQIREMIGPSKKDPITTDVDNKPAVSRQNVQWTRDEDKLIIYNCQRYGITKKAIYATAAALKTRTAQEVLNRFMHLMIFLTKVIKKQ